MTEHIVAYGADIFGHHITAAFDEGIRTRCKRQVDGSTGRTAETNHLLEVGQSVLVGETGGEHDVDDVAAYFFVDIYFANHFARIENFIDGNHRPFDGSGFEYILLDDSFFFFFGRIVDDYLQHETVYLRFGQRISAFLLDRVLRRHHQERIRQLIGLLSDSYLTFLHGFEQGALHFGRSAVDFIRQHEVGENRSVFYHELFVALAVDHRSDYVGRQQVGRKLNTAVPGVD